MSCNVTAEKTTGAAAGEVGSTIGDPDGFHWQIKPISALASMPHSTTEWIWKPYLAARKMHGWVGVPKAGKTTLLVHALAAMSRGQAEFAGRPVTPVKTLIVTQEEVSDWEDRRKECGLKDDLVKLLFSPKGSLRVLTSAIDKMKAWDTLARGIAQAVKDGGYGLVVFDLINSYWPVREENDSTQVKEAIQALHPIQEAGAAVLGLQHAPKDGRKTGRGSNALEGECDVFVFIEERPGNQRLLTRRNRVGGLDGMGAEALELTAAGYRSLGKVGEAAGDGPEQPDQTDRKIMKLLQYGPPGDPAQEIQKSLKIDLRNVRERLARGARLGWWVQGGGEVKDGVRRAVKGKPFLYHLKPDAPAVS